MTCDWKECQIGEVCEGIFDGPHATPKKIDSGPVFLGISNLKSGRLDLSNIQHVSNEDYKKWTKRVTPRKDDVVFSYETRLGEAAIIPEGLKCCLGRRMALMRPNISIVDPHFLLYAFLSPGFQNEIKMRTVHGSTVDRILLTEFPEYSIRIPSIEDQKRIASLLKALDDKIELNRQMNETIEAMARAIFKSWFVDFDPVRAKMNGQKPYGMDDQTAALFPDSFEDSPIGKIPKGWKAKPLYDFATFTSGRAFKSSHFSPDREGHPIIKIAELKNGVTGQTKYSDQSFETKYWIGNGAMLFSWSGSPETSIDTFLWTGPNGWLNQHIFNVDPKPSVPKSYMYFLLKFLKPIFIEIAKNKQTTGLGHVTVKDLKELLVPAPPKSILESIDSIMGPLFSKIINNQVEENTLASVRDSLLPKLVSGEVNVNDLPV